MGFTWRNADPRPLRPLLGEVTVELPSLLVSSRSMGDLGLSRLLEGLESSSLLSSNFWGGDEAEVVGEVEAAAALSICCLRPALRPNRGPVKPESKLGVGGLTRPARGNLNPEAGLGDPDPVEAAGGPPVEGAEAAEAAKSGLNMNSQWDK